MKASIAPAQTDPHERIVKAAVIAVYDRYCSGSIAELESAVLALIGQPIPDEEDDHTPSPQPNLYVSDAEVERAVDAYWGAGLKRELDPSAWLIATGNMRRAIEAAKTVAVQNPAPSNHVAGREQQLEDALRNLMGCYDTPLSRRRFPPNDFMNEALEIARELISSPPMESEIRPLWISPSELRRLNDASKHEPGTVYRSDEAAGLNGLDDEPPIPLYPSTQTNVAGWLDLSEEAKSAGRILLLWKPFDGVKEHIELGRWDKVKLVWVNTYGLKFTTDPDQWSPLAPFAQPKLSSHVKADPDYCYNPEDWEYTCSWDVRDEVHGHGEGLELGEPLRICTLVKGPDKWVADVPVEWDEAGDVINTEVKWFDTEAEALAALATEGK